MPGSFFLRPRTTPRRASRRSLRWCSRTLRSILCLSCSVCRFDLRALSTLPGLTIAAAREATCAQPGGREWAERGEAKERGRVL
eukprot:scaffold36677_cov25-Tisochrysis_lutea.AAC.2